MTLEDTLKQFDAVEANLVRLEKLWAKIEGQIPEGICFYGISPEQRAYDDLCRAFDEIRDALPAIDGWRIMRGPMSLDDIGHARFEAAEIGEIGVTRRIEQDIFQAGEDLHEYRHRMNKKRREVVGSRLNELVPQFEAALARLVAMGVPRDASTSVRGVDWDILERTVDELERLLGSSRSRQWTDFQRHLRFAQGVDLWDIVERDWPAAKVDIEEGFITELEPVPVQTSDLADLVAQRPAGPVTTALDWKRLSDENFERLVFRLISEAGGYENSEWLTRTRAPDRGRDLSVYRVQHDVLAGTRRSRIIIQCKHWLSKSLRVEDVSSAWSQMAFWESPPVDVLVIATSGRFTSDAVEWIEKHNHARKQPSIEPWPESHLERLLAARPHLVAEFRLR